MPRVAAGSRPSASPRILRVVAIASRQGRYGGPFDTATRQANTLLGCGRRARVLAGIFDGDQPHVDALAPGRYVRVRSLIQSKQLPSTFSLRIAIAIVQEILHADVVHVSFAREPIPIWTAAVASATRRTLIVQPHGMLTARTSSLHRFADQLYVRRLFRSSAAVVALSPTEAEELRRWNNGPAPRMHVLGNPLPPSLRRPEVPRSLPVGLPPRVVFIARLHPRKRVQDFLRAAHAAHSVGHRSRWVIVGPDEGQADLVRAAQTANPAVDYLGPVTADQVVDELDRSSIFVMPSEREPWGNVLASAIALGIPSVVTRSAALAPAVQTFGAGRVVPDRDPDSILDAVVDLTGDTAYRDASAGAIRLRAHLLDPGAIRRGLLDVLDSAVRPPEDQPPARR